MTALFFDWWHGSILQWGIVAVLAGFAIVCALSEFKE